MSLTVLHFQFVIAFTERNMQVPVSMAIGNLEHIQVFSQTLAHGNRKSELGQKNGERRQEEQCEYVKKYNGQEKICRACRPPLEVATPGSFE